jgi:hypothetical protein
MMVDCREEYFGIQTVDADMALSNRRMYFHILFVNLIVRLSLTAAIFATLCSEYSVLHWLSYNNIG